MRAILVSNRRSWLPASRSVRWMIAAGSTAWVVLQVVATAAAGGAAIGVSSSVSGVAYLVGAIVCHQLPTRSFHVAGAQWPVCARCTGIYAGAALASLLAAALPMRALEARVVQAVRFVLALAIVPTVMTLLYEWTTGVAPGNLARAAAGLPLGAIVAWVVVVTSAPPAAVAIH